jgi:hypothetical protein
LRPPEKQLLDSGMRRRGKFYKHGIKINGTKDGFMQNAKSFLENH